MALNRPARSPGRMVRASNNPIGRYLLATVVGLLAISLVVLAFAVGYVVRGDGGTSSPTTAASNSSSDPTAGNFSNLNQIMKLLQDKYVDPDKIDQESLYEAAINGMLQTLSDSDVYYVDPNTVQTSDSPSGTFQGNAANDIA